ncbi:MAG: fumarylacetoacetate hydrolase family protein [Desulfomonilia bacterium]|nr:fumarylacetoacetate hydrolase family protein [Desulfomonilia bacterium]
MLAPVQPSKIVAVGLNYRDHARELSQELPREPLLFLKPSSSIIGPDDTIIYPNCSSRVDYEAELAVVISRTCSHVRKDQAREYIFGYTCFNDVTARDLQIADGQWTRAKSFDTFSPIGPWIVTDVHNPHALTISSRLNGEIRQLSSTEDLIFGVFDLVEFISSVMTLYPGDVIATGTPSGIGPMNRSDEITIEIEGIGALRNTVK